MLDKLLKNNLSLDTEDDDGGCAEGNVPVWEETSCTFKVFLHGCGFLNS